MTTRRVLLGSAAGLAACAGFGWLRPATAVTAADNRGSGGLSEAEWRRRLTPAQFDVLRQAGTELPFSSPLDMQFASGRYECVGCGNRLFSSSTKFDSHTGWPSFYEPLRHAVARTDDGTLGMQRTEVRCVQCQGHLGHVFDDGPRPTGLRYCMNGVALHFVPGASA